MEDLRSSLYKLPRQARRQPAYGEQFATAAPLGCNRQQFRLRIS